MGLCPSKALLSVVSIDFSCRRTGRSKERCQYISASYISHTTAEKAAMDPVASSGTTTGSFPITFYRTYKLYVLQSQLYLACFR